MRENLTQSEVTEQLPSRAISRLSFKIGRVDIGNRKLQQRRRALAKTGSLEALFLRVAEADEARGCGELPRVTVASARVAPSRHLPQEPSLPHARVCASWTVGKRHASTRRSRECAGASARSATARPGGTPSCTQRGSTSTPRASSAGSVPRSVCVEDGQPQRAGGSALPGAAEGWGCSSRGRSRPRGAWP